ncbi:hypothetical protein JOJ88_002233 [Pantoea cypripedii]|nr:hypothetical protein [Pantoea cypripedii]
MAATAFNSCGIELEGEAKEETNLISLSEYRNRH